MTFGGVRLSDFGMQWRKLIQDQSSNIVLHDAIAIAHNGGSYGWAAQVFKCFAEHGKSSPLVAGAPVEVQPDVLQLSFQKQQQAAFDAVPPWTRDLALARE